MARTEDGRLLFRCGSCFHRMSVPLEQAGKRGQCARCGKLIRIPGKKKKKKRHRSRAKRRLIDLPQDSKEPAAQEQKLSALTVVAPHCPTSGDTRTGW